METTSTTTTTSTTSSTAETHVIPLIWDLEITDKQKRKQEKRNRRKERKARKNPHFITSESNSTSAATSTSELTRGCGSPTFLLSRGINFDRSDFDKNGFFPTGSKLILKCEDGAKPHPKVSTNIQFHDSKIFLRNEQSVNVRERKANVHGVKFTKFDV